MIKAIFFDIFGTLVDWRASLIKQIIDNRFFKKSPLFVEEFVINWRLEYQPILNKVNSNKISWMLLDDLHLITLNNVIKKMKINHLNNNRKKQLVNFWHKLKPWNDTVKALNAINKNFITCSLSNGNIKLQKNLVKYANLEFDFLFSAENFKKYKPDLSVYLRAAASISLSPSECALVASHKSDLKAANKAGFRTIYINRAKEYGGFLSNFPETAFSSDYSVNTLYDLRRKLKAEGEIM